MLDPAAERADTLPALPTSVREETVWALQADRYGHMWAGTDRDGLYCLDVEQGAALVHLTIAQTVPVLCLGGAHMVWASVSGYGVVYIDARTGEVVQRVGLAEGLPQELVQAIHVDERGLLWAGTWSGWLACIDPARGAVLCTLRLAAAEDTQHPVIDLSVDPLGRLWDSTYGGGLLGADTEQCAVVDRVGRYGGEEIAFILPEATLEDGIAETGARAGWRGSPRRRSPPVVPLAGYARA